MNSEWAGRGGNATRALARLGVAALVCLGSSAFALAPDDVDVRVSGRVVDESTQQPVPGAMVYVHDWRAVCDTDGRFVITLPEGRWTIEAAANRYQPSTLPVDACAECKPEVEIPLVPMHSVEERVEISARVNGGSDLVATTPVRPAEVLNAAGAFENVFRVLQTLPGVTSTGEMSSRLSVRGGGPDQNMTVMDGVEIHNPYRLYGLVSAFNPETVQGFELATGAFSAQYGDRLSSILTIENRDGRTSSPVKGSVGLSLTDGNAILEGRIPGGIGSWLVTGRRTWYDLVAERFTEGDNELPAFTDYQARVAFDLGGGRNLMFSGLRSRERSNMEFSEDFESGLVNSTTRNDLVAATLFLPLGARASSRTIAAFYDNTDEFGVDGSFRDTMRRSNAPYDDVAFGQQDVAGTIDRKVRDRSLRQELTFRPFGSHVLGLGFELHDLETSERLAIDIGDRPDEGLRQTSLSYDAKRSHVRYGGWLLDRFHLGSRIDVEAGLRFDESRINEIRELMPRLSLNARITSSTRLRAAYGVHTQSPGYEKLLQADYALDLSQKGPLKLDNERATHYVIGIERDLAPGLSARVEGFYKQYEQLIVGRQETPEELRQRLAFYDFPAELAAGVPRQAMITADPVNDGRGRAYGFDVFLARRPTSSNTRLSGWLAYTYTSANRQAYGRTYPFDYEQPHSLSLVANFRASQRLEFSLTGRLTSGFPRTAPLGLYVTGVLDSVDADGDGVTEEIVPERDGDGRLVYAIDYGGVANLNRARLPWYSRVDFRATFVPRWGKGRWRFYVDVINVLGRNNGLESQGLAYAPDASVPKIVSKKEDNGFPLMPSFGVHVRF